MKIKEIYSSNIQEIKSKKFNVFIALCLGNQFFLDKTSINKKNIKKYLNLALKHTKEKVIFLIADKIQITNYNVRNNNTRSYNVRRIAREGEKIKENLSNFIKKNYKRKLNKIDIIQWEDYEKEDPLYESTTKLIYEQFNKNSIFKGEVFNRIKGTMIDRPFTKEQYWEMCNYLLDEFSTVYSGIQYKKVDYGIFFYPKMDSTAMFIDEIRTGKLFPEIREKLPKRLGAMAIVN